MNNSIGTDMMVDEAYAERVRSYTEIANKLMELESEYSSPDIAITRAARLWDMIETLRWVLKRIDNLDGHRV